MILGLLVLLAAIPAAAQVPQGSYQKSCKNIEVNHDTLKARCKDMNGHWVNTSLDNFNQCNGINNVNGQLQCGSWNGDRDRDRDRDGDRGHAPPGSYRQTCRDVRVEGDRLLAKCESSDGRWLDTSLDDYQRCVGDIVNDEGRLECGRQGGRSVPQGSYSRTCRQIYVRGDTLRAQCETRDGRWIWTQLNDWDSCRSIVNDDGHLLCRR